jgi:hypothetical protein
LQRPESCEDQEREVRKGLARLGVDATDAVVLHDHAESGTKNDRAQFEKVLGMIKRGEVAVLAVDDQARFSRANNVYGMVTDLVFASGRFISTGEGIDTNQPGWELRVKVMELHNSTAILELGRRVRRGQLGRVLDDGSAGDFPYGYRSFFLDPNQTTTNRRGPKPKKGIEIYEEEARWVRQVFAWFAVESKSIAWIARELTRLGVDKGNKASTAGWHHQQVRRMLARQKYIGQWPWNMTQTVRNSEGKTKQVPVPEEEWVVRERPELRIIDQATWDRAQARLRKLDDTYGAKDGQEDRGPKPHHSEVYPTSLLGGLVYCHACGSRLWVQGSGPRNYLGCPNHRKGLCAMAARVPVPRAEAAVAEFLTETFCPCPEWVALAVAAMRAALDQAAESVPASVKADEALLADRERKIGNLVDQLADGGLESVAVRQRLKQLEREVEEVRSRIAENRSLCRGVITFPEDAWVQEQLCGMGPLLKEDVGRAAMLLRQLLGKVTAEDIVAVGKRADSQKVVMSLESR